MAPALAMRTTLASTMSITHHFGPFELRTTERLLLQDGQALTLGSRALDVLIALVEAAGERLSKSDLLERAWPGMVVEEANVHVQVSQLRKLLEAEAIGTVAGLGYRFTMPLKRGPARHNLPVERTVFVGRDAALVDARRRLVRTRLLTLVGIGGSGKTRLARKLAERALAEAIDDVWWVDLAPVDGAELLLPTVAQAVGCPLPGQGRAIEALTAHLGNRVGLLVMDNCENLLDAVAATVDALLAAAPGLRVLATSREALDLTDEVVLPVRPLELPPPGATADELMQSEAVRLLVLRAEAARPGFTLAEGDAAVMAEICRRLDGIPLALELAAARLRVIAPAQLLDLLSQRFRLLIGNRRALPRHETLATVIQWSHDHLQPTEQRLLGGLAVCAGGCELGALGALIGPEVAQAEVLAGLARLANLSLLETYAAPATLRYGLLDTVRQFALERLQEAGAIAGMRQRHAALYLTLAEAAFIDIDSRGEGEAALARLDLDRDNLLRALDWLSFQPDPTAKHAALRLVAALRYYWPSRGLMQLGITLTRAAVERAAALPFDHAQASALASLALMLGQTGEQQASLSWAQRLLDRATAVGDDSDRLMARLVAGEVDCSGGRLDQARNHFQAAQQLAVALGLVRRQIGALSGLARVEAYANHTEEAARLADEVLVLRRQDGHGYNLIIALLNVASTALERDQVERAMPMLAEAVALAPRVGSDYLTAHVLAVSAQLFARRGRWAAAVELRAAAHLQEQAQRLFVHEAGRQQQRTDLERARQALGEHAFEVAWQAGLERTAASSLARAAEHLYAEAMLARAT